MTTVGSFSLPASHPMFAGHFPGNPIMPGVKIVEALAQCGAVAVLSQPENRGKLALFGGIDDVRFKRIVEPGDELVYECTLETVRGPVGKGKATADLDVSFRQLRTCRGARAGRHWAMCGRLRVGKSFLHASSSGRSSHVFGLLARFT